MSLCKSVLKHCKGVPDYRTWEDRLASLVTAHPGLDGETSSESEGESPPGDRSSEPPPSPPTSGESLQFLHALLCTSYLSCFRLN